MGEIYWLASYPKSGNTWMRILLTNYLINADQPININELTGLLASSRQTFDEYAGVESSDLLPHEIEHYRPAVYEAISTQFETEGSVPLLFVKVHDALTKTADGVCLFPKTASAGVIYLLRNPLDVAVSYANHNGESVEQTVMHMGQPGYTLALHENRMGDQLRQRLLTWSDHVTSWVDEPSYRVLTVRYEDMVADTVATFARVIRFCGLEVDPVRIAKAVEFSRFERLQAQEIKAGFRERSRHGNTFFRKGKVGSGREGLNQGLIGKLISDHGDVMRRFGYLDDINAVLD